MRQCSPNLCLQSTPSEPSRISSPLQGRALDPLLPLLSASTAVAPCASPLQCFPSTKAVPSLHPLVPTPIPGRTFLHGRSYLHPIWLTECLFLKIDCAVPPLRASPSATVSIAFALRLLTLLPSLSVAYPHLPLALPVSFASVFHYCSRLLSYSVVLSSISRTFLGCTRGSTRGHVVSHGRTFRCRQDHHPCVGCRMRLFTFDRAYLLLLVVLAFALSRIGCTFLRHGLAFLFVPSLESRLQDLIFWLVVPSLRC